MYTCICNPVSLVAANHVTEEETEALEVRLCVGGHVAPKLGSLALRKREWKML